MVAKIIQKEDICLEWNDDKHLDRPFGKMKNDILKEIINWNGK